MDRMNEGSKFETIFADFQPFQFQKSDDTSPLISPQYWSPISCSSGVKMLKTTNKIQMYEE